MLAKYVFLCSKSLLVCSEYIFARSGFWHKYSSILELQPLWNLVVQYSYRNAVPNPFVFTVAELAVLRELVQAPDERLHGLTSPLDPLVKAGAVMDDVPFGYTMFIKLFHHNVTVKLGVWNRLRGSRKHKRTVDGSASIPIEQRSEFT